MRRGTINYEIVTRIGRRVTRSYLRRRPPPKRTAQPSKLTIPDADQMHAFGVDLAGGLRAGDLSC